MYKINKLSLALICAAFAIFQSSFSQAFSIGKIRPDLLLVIIIFFALREGAGTGLFTGALCGLLADILSGTVFGVSIFTFGLLGMFIGAQRNRLYTESPFIQIAVVLAISICAQAFYHFVLNLFVRTPNIGAYLIYLIIPCGIYTAMVSPMMFYILNKFSPAPRYRHA